jgi:hypothetical protein
MYRVEFFTDIVPAPVVVTVNRSLAPLGADWFYELVHNSINDDPARADDLLTSFPPFPAFSVAVSGFFRGLSPPKVFDQTVHRFCS